MGRSTTVRLTMKGGSGRFSDQATKGDCRVRFSYISRACTRRSVSKDRRNHCIHREDHQQHKKTRDRISGCSVKNRNCAESAKKQIQRELSSALVVPCRSQDSQRNEGADRARRPDVFGIVSLTSVEKKKPPADDDVDNQKKSTSPSLLPMLFGGQRERVSPTQMTQQERRRSSFSKHLGPRRFAETRVDGNIEFKWTRSPKRGVQVNLSAHSRRAHNVLRCASRYPTHKTKNSRGFFVGRHAGLAIPRGHCAFVFTAQDRT